MKFIKSKKEVSTIGEKSLYHAWLEKQGLFNSTDDVLKLLELEYGYENNAAANIYWGAIINLSKLLEE